MPKVNEWIGQMTAYQNLANAIIKNAYIDLVTHYMDLIAWEHYDGKYYTEAVEKRFRMLLRKAKIYAHTETYAVRVERRALETRLKTLIKWFNGESYAKLNPLDPNYLIEKAQREAKNWAETGIIPKSVKKGDV